MLTSPSLGPWRLHGVCGLCEDLGHLTEPTTGSVKFSSWHWKDEGWLSGRHQSLITPPANTY